MGVRYLKSKEDIYVVRYGQLCQCADMYGMNSMNRRTVGDHTQC